MTTKIHIGCGKRNWKGWYNVDIDKDKHIHSDDIFLDNFKDNSIDLIYASHFLEYFNIDECMELLKSWWKKLKKGGELYLSVPDFKKIAELYINEKVPLNRFIGPLYGRMDVSLDMRIYHKQVFDEARLREILMINKFRRIEPYESEELIGGEDDHSKAEVLGKRISLNLKCKK